MSRSGNSEREIKMPMHEGEIAIDHEMVARLVATQFPEFADLPIRAFASTGTVNSIYRIGDLLCARLPRLQKWAASLERELSWLPRLAPALSLQIPAPVAVGRATGEYPYSWSIYRWIDGEPYRDSLVHNERHAASDLAEFVSELRGVDPTGAPRGGRQPLEALDVVTRAAIEASRSAIDGDAAAGAWQAALESPIFDGRPVWIHADLLRPNVLVGDGCLRAVIDFGSAGVGDPAADVIAAWSIFGESGRATFRDALEVDDGTWSRARGYALAQAVQIIPYYAQTNPAFVGQAKRTVEEILFDYR